MAAAGWLRPGIAWIFSREGLMQGCHDLGEKKPIEASVRIGGQSWLFTTF